MIEPSIVTEDLRLRVVQLLNNEHSRELSTAVIAQGLRAIGHAVTTTWLLTQCEWLRERDLVALPAVPEDLREAFGADIRLVRLTERGHEVAARRLRVDGVAAPFA